MATTAASPASRRPHRWRFFRAGGLDLVHLDTADDLRNLESLDQKLWSALACPVKGLQLDEKTLALIDADHDGRVRAPEVLAAVNWVCESLHDPALIVAGGESVPLAAIKDAGIVASAQQILSSLGKTSATAITLADVADTALIFSRTRFNGDGVITPDSAGDDAATRQAIADIVATMGGVADRGGPAGIDQAKLDAFFADAAAFAAWTRSGEEAAATVLPLGSRTAVTHTALSAVRPKIDDYFARCRLASFDPRALAAVNRQESEYLALVAKDLSVTASEIGGFPLALIQPGRALPLGNGVNPAWVEAITHFRNVAIAPVLGAREELTENDWATLKATFAAYEGWRAARAGGAVEPLGIERVRVLLGDGSREKIAALLAQDRAMEPQFTAITSVERLVRYQRDLYRLLLNFVSFADFYAPDRLAIFQIGTLYLDARACELVIRVEDAAKHAAIAGLSQSFLAYCDCVRASTGEKMTVAVAFTNGDADRLIVGRNGVLYDRKGRDWDATIVKVVESPISIREAFWSPYKKLVRKLEEQVARHAAETDTANTTQFLATAAQPGPATPPAPPPKKRFDVGTVAALGVAAGAIGTFLSVVFTKFIELGPWMPVGVLCVLLLISTPSMLIAALKLRQRNLGPILDATGWAVNGRARINFPFGATLTDVARLPPGAHRTFRDPYGGRKTSVAVTCAIVLLLAVAGWFLYKRVATGRFDYWNVPREQAPAPDAEGKPPETPPADAPAPEAATQPAATPAP